MYRTGVAAGHNGPTVFLLKGRIDPPPPRLRPPPPALLLRRGGGRAARPCIVLQPPRARIRELPRRVARLAHEGPGGDVDRSVDEPPRPPQRRQIRGILLRSGRRERRGMRRRRWRRASCTRGRRTWRTCSSTPGTAAAAAMTGAAVCPIFAMRARCREEPGGGRGGMTRWGGRGCCDHPPPLS